MGGTIRFRAEEWLEEAVPVEPGGTLFVNADRGSVDVRSHALDEVRIEAEARGWRAGLVTFWLERDGNDVYVDASIDRFLPRLLGAAHIAIRAWVPRSYSVDAETRGGRVRIEGIHGEVAAQARGGQLKVRQIEGSVVLRAGGGDVGIEEIDGDVRARTSGGRVEMVGIRGDIEARTSGGRVEALAIDGQLDLRSSGGSVRASFVHEPCGRLESSGGGIDVAFPDTAQVDLDARTSGGRVFLEHPLDEITRRSNRVVGRINGGGLPLLIRTSGGPLHIRRC
ncbi:MAG: DUF4097 family beta strand repeat-containing protein [Myxococcota bacterium]